MQSKEIKPMIEVIDVKERSRELNRDAIDSLLDLVYQARQADKDIRILMMDSNYSIDISIIRMAVDGSKGLLDTERIQTVYEKFYWLKKIGVDIAELDNCIAELTEIIKEPCKAAAKQSSTTK